MLESAISTIDFLSCKISQKHQMSKILCYFSLTLSLSSYWVFFILFLFITNNQPVRTSLDPQAVGLLRSRLQSKTLFLFNADGNTPFLPNSHRPTAFRGAPLKSGFSFSSLSKSLSSHYTFLLHCVIVNAACGDQIYDFEFFGANTATRQSSVEFRGVELKREVAGCDSLIRPCAFG